MPNYFPFVVTKVVEVPVGDGSAVDTEQLRYDNRVTGRKADVLDSVDVNTSDVSKKANEEVTAALAADVVEVNEKSDETISLDLSFNELGQRAEDFVEAVAVIQELNRDALGTTTSVDIVSKENTKKAVEDVSNEVTASLSEVAKKTQEDITAAIIPVTSEAKKANGTEVVEVTVRAFLDSVISNTGFGTPNSALNNTTNSAATLTATASGVLGTTNNTTNGTHIARFKNIELGDLTITSVILRVENQHANAGIPIVQPTCNIAFQYSTNSGSSWTTFYTLTGQTAKGIRDLNLTSVIGQDKALLAGGVFRVRATGNVTSGTGVGSGSTASYFRAWLTILAERTYT